MKLFRKLAVNVHSQVETLANQFENKEALSTSYIREYERIVAQAKVKLAQVEAEADRLEKQSAHLEAQAALWAERARRVHTTDQEKALACVRRMKKAQADQSLVVRELDETRNLKRRMAQDVEQTLHKLGDLKRRHRLLTGRQTCAEALNVVQPYEAGLPDEVDDLYTRWETDVTARELHNQTAAPATDSLAEAFDRHEEEDDLRLTLEALITSHNETKE
jgi:phage shock protein A